MGQATAWSRPGATAPITPNIKSTDAKLDSNAAALALLVNVASCRALGPKWAMAAVEDTKPEKKPATGKP